MGLGHERRVAQHTRWLLGGVLAGVFALLCGCTTAGDSRAFVRGPQDTAERPSGCIDTPFIAGDVRSTTSGVSCGRGRSPDAALLRGRVVREELGSLPGAGLEGVWVTLHPLEDGFAQLDALPLSKAEAETGPQGSFSIALTGAKEYVIVVRAEPDSPPLAARRIEASDDRTHELVLMVPGEP